MKQISTILAAGIILFFSSCGGGASDEKKAEDSTAAAVAPPAKPAFVPFKLAIIQHPVKNFGKWKAVYLAHDSVRKAYGISQFALARDLDDSNMVTVVNKFDDVQKAKQFAALPNLKEAMQKGGVMGAPTFDYIEVVRNNDSVITQKERMMVVHKVKDYGAWLKVFDAEGTAKRAEYGLLDRGIARGIDDPNMVYVLFAVTDMAKAKARGQSEELKKLMTDAGVVGPPKMHLYRLVE